MPRTKPKPDPQTGPQAPTSNGPVGEVFNLAEAAAYLRLPETDVLRLVREQALPARQLGSEWRFLKAAIQDWLRTSSPPTRDFWEAASGAFKDDPHWQEIVQEAFRRRGRPLKEGG